MANNRLKRPRRTGQLAGDQFEREDLSTRLVTVTDPDSPAAEAYRALSTNLVYALVDIPAKVIVMTSPNRAEGKSTTCANLGVVLAQANKNTLVMECDFRKPVLHKIFGLRNLLGVVDVLAGERDLQEVSQETFAPNLKVTTVGPVPANPAELLNSKRFSDVLSHAREVFDYVLIDVPPVTLFADALVVAAQGDGVLLVLDSQSTPKRSVRQAMRRLEAVKARVLGTVVNNAWSSTESRAKEYY
jgi:capsular exopolysaccharide synthesis family protein